MNSLAVVEEGGSLQRPTTRTGSKKSCKTESKGRPKGRPITARLKAGLHYNGRPILAGLLAGLYLQNERGKKGEGGEGEGG